jgi:hypothetical protein
MVAVLKRVLIVGVVIAGVAAVLRRVGPRMCPAANRAIEKMPDDAPPKWMFNNIKAIREQTEAIGEQNERIVKLLESRHPVDSVPAGSAV